jgi:hypothetical protein
MFSKDSDEISFESYPSGAQIYNGTELYCTTPCKKTLKRETFRPITITVKKEGYQSQDVLLQKTVDKVSLFNFGFITTTGGATSWGIDALNGNMIEFFPHSYVIELTKRTSGTQGMKPLHFLVVNFKEVQADIARGGGEHLEAYAILSNIPVAHLESILNGTASHKVELLNTTDALAMHRQFQSYALAN